MSPVKGCQKQCVEGQLLSDGKPGLMKKHSEDTVDQIPDKIRKEQRHAFSKQVAYDMIPGLLFVKITGYKEKNKNMERIIGKKTPDIKEIVTEMSRCYQDNADCRQNTEFSVFFVFPH